MPKIQPDTDLITNTAFHQSQSYCIIPMKLFDYCQYIADCSASKATAADKPR